MARTPSTMPPLGGHADKISLPDPFGKIWTLEQLRGPSGLLVMFICNHCPFVKHVAGELARLGRDLPQRGVGVVAINSNDVDNYPDDRPEMMVAESKARDYRFPYLYDETQEVARAYQAACTPDFFLFDANLQLFYRGQLDASRPSSDVAVTGRDLRHAVDAMLSGKKATEPQIPSIGCNIKWRVPH